MTEEQPDQKDHFVFIFQDDSKSLDLIFTYIKKVVTFDDIDQENANASMKWMPVSQDFAQVYSQPSLSQWVHIDTLDKWIKERQQLNSAESIKKFDLGSHLHELADSLPVAGFSVHLYFFLHSDALESEDSFTHLCGAVLRLEQWHHVRMVLVRLDSVLSVPSQCLATGIQCQMSCIDDDPHSIQTSWTGKVSVTDFMTRDRECVEFLRFGVDCPKWNVMLKEAFSVSAPRQIRTRSRKELLESSETSKRVPVCDHNIEVLQEVDLRTFPLFLLTPWTFDLHTLRSGSKLVEYLQEKPGMGLLARLRVYPRSEQLPLCGETTHLSTTAWEDFMIFPSLRPSMMEVGYDDYQSHASNSEYLHVLILPNNKTSLSSTTTTTHYLWMRILLTTKQAAKNVVNLLRENTSLETKSSSTPSRRKKCGQGDFNEDTDKVQRGLESLLLLQVADFFSEVKQLFLCRKGASKNLSGDDAAQKSEELCDSNIAKLASRIIGPLHRRSEMNRTLFNALQELEQDDDKTPDWISECARGLSHCPEWLAIIAEIESSGQNMTAESYCDTSIRMSKQTTYDKKDLSTEHIISCLFKEESSGAATRIELSEMPFKNQPDSKAQLSKNATSNKLDVYHYHTEEDFDLEQKYAEIRDHGGFQDTKSSFLTPQKKFNRQLRHNVPTRSSPRTKPQGAKLSSRHSPKRIARLESIPTFKLPQSLHSASSSQRKRPISSLTPDFDSCRPTKFPRTNSLPNPLHSSTPTGALPDLLSTSGKFTHKRVALTSVLDTKVRRSPRKLPRSQSMSIESSKVLKRTDSSQNMSEERPIESSNCDQNAKMKRSERHMMRLKNIISKVLKEKGLTEGDAIYDACSKHLLNVSIILLKTLPNSKNLTDEMKSVVYGQVQQIINLEKRRSGIAI